MIRNSRVRPGVVRAVVAGVAVALAASLAGCADGYYGGGVATGYYDGPVGYGADYYGGVGYPAYGVYNDYYYPGSGIYVFDRFGHRRPWNDDERRHWEYRGGNFRGNHLMDNGRHFDARRDHAYMADRNAGFRSFRQGGAVGGGRQGGERSGGEQPGGGHRRQ